MNSDTPDYAIVGGTPSKILGRVNGETGELEWFSQQNNNEDPYLEAWKRERTKRKELKQKYVDLENRIQKLEKTLQTSTI